jgi:8-oxo-dGTP pyrophosphatase MutT (NUDIX family)
MSLRPATTVLLLRDAPTASGMEVFMLQRNRRAGFLPNAWVFPGGRVDAGDALHEHPRVMGGSAALAAMGLDRPVGLPFLVAGVRETFEESGIWLGSGDLPDAARDPLNRGDVKLADLLDTHDATLELDRVVPWSWWITPVAEPKRFDTRFLLARAVGGGRHDDGETVDSRWVCPLRAIEQGSLDVFPTAPPTWWTLYELSRAGGVEGAFTAATSRPQRPIQPIMRFTTDGMDLLLPGHPDHPEPTLPGLPDEVRFEDRRWVAMRGGERITVPAFPPGPT